MGMEGAWKRGGVEGTSLLKGACTLPRHDHQKPTLSRQGSTGPGGPELPHSSPTSRPLQPWLEPSRSRLRATRGHLPLRDRGRKRVDRHSLLRSGAGNFQGRRLGEFSQPTRANKGPGDTQGPCVPAWEAPAPSRLSARPGLSRCPRAARAALPFQTLKPRRRSAQGRRTAGPQQPLGPRP